MVKHKTKALHLVSNVQMSSTVASTVLPCYSLAGIHDVLHYYGHAHVSIIMKAVSYKETEKGRTCFTNYG